MESRNMLNHTNLKTQGKVKRILKEALVSTLEKFEKKICAMSESVLICAWPFPL